MKKVCFKKLNELTRQNLKWTSQLHVRRLIQQQILHEDIYQVEDIKPQKVSWNLKFNTILRT